MAKRGHGSHGLTTYWEFQAVPIRGGYKGGLYTVLLMDFGVLMALTPPIERTPELL